MSRAATSRCPSPIGSRRIRPAAHLARIAALLVAVLAADLASAGMSFPGGGVSQPAAPPTVLTPPALPPGGREALCALRDEVLDHTEDLFQKLGLTNLFRNYYCDGGCFMCCYVPTSGSCHTSFDYNDLGNPPINCSDIYGPGTTIAGEALVTGDPTGTGVCLAVQQVCTHLPVCTAGATAPASAAAGPESAGEAAAATQARMAGGDGFARASSEAGADSSETAPQAASSSPPPHPDMTLPGAIGSRAKAFTKNMLHHFTENVKSRPPGTALRDYVDFVTARGTRDWRKAMQNVEPYSGQYSVFRVEDANGNLLPDESHQLGILYHAQLGLLGAVPNVLDRLAYVESRYWTDEEKNEYLAGVDPEAELRKTMGPIVLETLKAIPIQDWRLLAVPAPNEAPIALRTYEGFELGRAPSVSLALDCADPGETRIAIGIDDPEAARAIDTLYPVIVDWGDGSRTELVYDASLPSNSASHVYAEPGTYTAYVTAANGTGLRGVAGIVVESTTGSGVANPASLATIALDPVSAWGPALSFAGDLAFALELRRPDGSVVEGGFSAEVRLANAGSVPLPGMIAWNEEATPFDALVLRPTWGGGLNYDSIYVQAPSITLGFFDAELGLVVTRTLPLEADMLEVYYAGASAPVDPALLERDINGVIRIPVERGNAQVPSGFCGAIVCDRVDRIEIPITEALLAARPASSPALASGLAPGDSARWLEDVPGTFIADPSGSGNPVTGSCGAALPVALVPADDPATSFVTSISIPGAGPTVAEGLDAQLQALATLADGRVVDVTDRVTWTSSDPNVLDVSNGFDKGLVRASTLPGAATIEAKLGDARASVVGLDVRPPRGYQTYRFQVTEIHGSVGRAGMNAVELIVDDLVLENRMTSLTEGTIGSFEADIASVPGGSAVNAFDASFGTGWTSPNGSFRTTAPYTVSSGPVYLQVDFEQPTPLEAIRLHRQGGILSASFLPQFPKQVVVEGSNDGVVFETVTVFNVVNWNFQPLEIPIPVPVPEPSLAGQLVTGLLALGGLAAGRAIRRQRARA
ncbi:MAG: Ig-like domain-containing protein [Deltaproteobacteria bacterium]|nr:Ig-like domain-containing protein [Deltaproteobacteria bacterium]